MKKMYCFPRLLALLLTLLAGPAAWGQAPPWQVALAASAGAAQAYGTAADASGNVYIVGSFNSSLTLGGKTVTTAGIADIFIAKWNPTSAAFEWLTRAGGTGYDEARAVTVSSSGIYLTGFTQSALINFGPSTLSPLGGSDVFVAKISPAGTFVWALQGGGTGTDEAYTLAANGASVYVGGYSSSCAYTFGTVGVANAAPSRATYDGFVAKLTDAGTSADWTWARGVGGQYNDEVQALAVQGTSVYAAGTFVDVAGFGALSLTAVAPGINDVFVVKLTDAGSTSAVTWAQRAGGAGYDYAYALAVYGSRVYVGGLFTGATAGFGSTTLTNAGGNAGSDDGFVARLTDAGSNGAFNWAVRLGGSGDDQVTGLVATATGPCATGFYYSGPATFGPITLPNYILSGGRPDAFVTQLADNTSTGSFAWAQRAGGTGNDFGQAIALSGSTLYVAGSITPQAIFTPLSVDAPVGVRVPFLASLAALPLAAAAPGAVGWPVALAPNPASGTATLTLPAVAGASAATLTLLDALGRPVLARTVALPAQVLLPLHGLPTGVYALRVQAGTTVATRRLVVE